MGGWFSTTVYVESRNFSGIGERIEWCLRYHFRGLFGTLIPVIYGAIAGEFLNKPKNAVTIANVMFISYLLQPVSLPVTGMYPIFLLPMCAILSTGTVCGLFFTSNASLIFMGGLMGFLLNNTGLDRRLITQILTRGNTPESYKPNLLLFKTCIAAFLTSFWGNHLYASATMYEYLEPIFAGFQIPPPPPPKKDKNTPAGPTEFKYHKFQHIINEALLISANLGHLNMIHTSWILLLMRHAFYGSHARGGHQDLFNYLQYMMFSLVFTTTALCVTILYFVVVLSFVNRNSKPMSPINLNMMTNKFQEARKNELAPMRTYQKVRNTVAMFLQIIAYIAFLTRYSPWCSWSILFRTENVISDATVAAIIIFILCAFPRHFGFLKICSANKKSELTLKPESGLLFWRFVDKAVNYGYMYILGGCISMIEAFHVTGVMKDASRIFSPALESLGLFLSLAILSLGTIVCCNMGSPVPMASAIIPYVLAVVGGPNRPAIVKDKAHLFALVCLLSSSFSYLFPFKNTISFHRNHLTRTKCKHVWSHAIVLALIHGVLLVVFATFLGSVIWFQTLEDFPAKKKT